MPENPRVTDDGTATWDCVWFGSYPQGSDGNGGYKKEKIKWRVLSVSDGEALLLADKNLDCKRYNETGTAVTWETSTVRSWLNGYGSESNIEGEDYISDNFINKAFTMPEEQDAIQEKTIENPDNSELGTKGGSDTRDKVFLLSIEEVTNSAYGFSSAASESSQTRGALNTDYAISQGADAIVDGNGYWWLRSPGRSSYFAANVGCSGWVYHTGESVNLDDRAIRPALFLDLKSSFWSSAGTVSSGGEVNEVEYIPVQSLQCEEKNVSLKEEEKKQIKVAIPPTNASIQKVIWTSSDESVATVDADGEVTAIGQGKATIEVRVVDGSTAQCQVTVTEKSAPPAPPQPPTTSGDGQQTTDKENQSKPSTEPTAESKPATSSTEATSESKPTTAKITKPKKVTLSKVKSTKRGTLKLTWKRDKKATGYQAVVATDKKFKKNKKSAFITKNKTVTKTFTKLKRKKTYFAKVRAYKKIGKTKVYGAYSKVKKAKVK